MVGCKECMLTVPFYEVRIESEENLVVLEKVDDFLKAKGIHHEKQTQIYIIHEEDMKDFYDFCLDHMNLDKVYYQMNFQKEWQTFYHLLTVLETNWIDSIILEQRIISWAQPIVDRDKKLYAHEILARFVRPNKSIILPSEVFGAAKLRNRLYALDKVCRLTAIRNAIQLPEKVFINFIPTSIYSPEHCLQSTIALSRQLGFHPSKIVFEVVESEYVKDISHLRRILDYYKNWGFHYALDDVGEDFNTMEVLHEIKPHYMKLDKSHVKGVAHSKSKQETAVQLLNTALDISAIPLAEGIECEEDFQWLKQKGYQLFQGYWIGRPEPIGSLEY